MHIGSYALAGIHLIMRERIEMAAQTDTKQIKRTLLRIWVPLGMRYYFSNTPLPYEKYILPKSIIFYYGKIALHTNVYMIIWKKDEDCRMHLKVYQST